MNLKMLEDMILVRAEEQGEKKVGSLYVPDTVKEEYGKGVVVAAGPGRTNQGDGNLLPMPVNIGDSILFSKSAFVTVSVNEEDLIIISATSVYAVIDNDAIGE